MNPSDCFVTTVVHPSDHHYLLRNNPEKCSSYTSVHFATIVMHPYSHLVTVDMHPPDHFVTIITHPFYDHSFVSI